MNKIILSTVFGVLFLTAASFAQTPPPAAVESAPAAPEVVNHPHHDHFPEIHKAMRKLRGAKLDLEKAAHDYGGHKEKAVAAIDGALAELQAAIDYARSK